MQQVMPQLALRHLIPMCLLLQLALIHLYPVALLLQVALVVQVLIVQLVGVMCLWLQVALLLQCCTMQQLAHLA